jgi:hypothetical protein
MAKMIVIVPTRGRPNNAARLVKAFGATDADGTDLLFRVDDDDPALDEYLKIDAEFVVGEHLLFGPKLNEQVAKSAPDYDIVGFMGDDHVPRTMNWDAAFAEVLHKTGIAYGNDLLQGETIPTAVFMTSNIPLTLGYFCAPGIMHMYIDNAWKDWGSRSGCLTYLPDVVLEHLHHVNGKAEMDNLYQESGALMESDRVRYNEYCASQMAADVDKIKALIS